MNTFSDTAALAAYWELPAGRAMSLRPRQDSVLRVAQGQVWATLDGPHARREGDLFLAAGEQLTVAAGQRVVIEPRGTPRDAPACFSWTPAPQPAAQAGATPWQQAVIQPVSDLRLALGNAALALRGAAGALLRLARGLAAGLALDRLTARGRLAGAERAFKAASSASRAHGAMN